MAWIDSFILWFAGHRTQFGSAFLSVGAVLALASQYYPSTHITAAGAIFGLIGSHLMVAGASKSDEWHKDKAEQKKLDGGDR